MAEYVTEQKRILKKILEDNSDSAYTVEELMLKMASVYPDGDVPGRSTVYRLMTHLVEEGSVKRFERYSPDYYFPISDHSPAFIDLEI